ncbi:hypothetical protein F4779DRAFT_277471 [Xylariaceae sp. FL0662B]|nr:hypothetical protein F4779DRAFT_277471 [Xylariaceae sp. FL0662B]
MHGFNSVAAVAAVLFSSASAMPNFHLPLHPRQTDAALEPWVTVDEDGQPQTVTPVLSTVDGTPTVVSGAPHDLTATVFTRTSLGKISTSTGSAPIATPTGGEAGSFSVCHNKDGPLAPWCQPTEGITLYPGTSYYFLWDTSYFPKPNTTILVQGNYFNETTGEITDQAFESPKIAASWGFWSHRIDSSLMKFQSAKNITLRLVSLDVNGTSSEFMDGPTVVISNYPPYTPDSGGKLPDQAALYIALPTVLGFVVLCIVGTCLWNRKTRKIDIGNIMSRSRHGYGIGKSSRSRMGIGKKNRANERIQLMEREVEADGGEVYRDEPDRPRRDSDALGSLAGTPTEERRMDFQRPGDRNQFRDELRRQNNERF